MKNTLLILFFIAVGVAGFIFLQQEQGKTEISAIHTPSTIASQNNPIVEENKMSLVSSEGLLADDFYSNETDEEFLVPIFGERKGSEYPRLVYYDQQIFLTDLLSPSGKRCRNLSVYARETKEQIYTSNDDCYLLFQSTSKLVLVSTKNIKVWNIGDQNFKDIPGARLSEGETYSSGFGCMGNCIETEVIGEKIVAKIYKDTLSGEQGGDRMLLRIVEY